MFSFHREVVFMSRLAGVIGSRSLPASFAPLVSRVVSLLLSRGYSIASGGAVGADSFALEAVIQQGAASRGIIHSAWASASGFPSVRSASGFSLSLLPAVRLFGARLSRVSPVLLLFQLFSAGTGGLFLLPRLLLLSFTASLAALFTQSVRPLSRAFRSLCSFAAAGRLCRLIWLPGV